MRRNTLRYCALRELRELPSRVMLLVQRFQPCLCDMRVNLRGGKIGVAEEHLDDAQIGAVVEQVRGEGVAQGMG